MPWQNAVDGFAKKTLLDISNEMRQAGLNPIVLRWKKPLRSSQNIYGMIGCRTWTGEKLDGSMESSGELDPKRLITFWPDANRMAFALVPQCDRNMNILAACLNDPATEWIVDDVEVVSQLKEIASKFVKVEPDKKEPAMGLTAKTPKKQTTLAELAQA